MNKLIKNDSKAGFNSFNCIAFLLGQFLRCSAYETVIFCWVLHQQEIVDSLLRRLITVENSVPDFQQLSLFDAMA